jgi:dGTPase
MTAQAQDIVSRLFEVYFGDYGKMPATHADQARALYAADGPSGGARVVADYIAGMTDRFALQAHDNL